MLRRQCENGPIQFRRYSAPDVSEATGDQAEFWFHFLFKSNSFNIVGKHTREYRGITWTKTGHDLDFIIDKDGIAYGVEVRNKFPYIDDDELDTKLQICAYFGIKPLFPFRTAPYSQIEKVKNQGGRILIFRSKIFPPGYRQLVNTMWNTMRLPVSIWTNTPPRIEQIFIQYHNSHIQP